MDTLWVLTAFGAAALWGLNYLAMEQTLKTMQTAQLILLTYGATLLFASFFIVVGLPESIALEAKLARTSPAWLATAVLTHGLAVICIVSSIKKASSHLAAIVEVSYPVFTVLFAFLLLGRTDIGLDYFIGGAMIMAGVVVIGYFYEI